MPLKKEAKAAAPKWFYYISILAAFLFTIYMSIYSAIHFEDIKYMNLVVIFLFISLVSFFLISAVYFHTEKKGYHSLAPILFFVGIVALLAYAYKAVDATNMVRYSIIYAISVVGISLFTLLPRRKVMVKKSNAAQRQA
ncbi:hypothetical protein HYV80_00480 [Candidatus Woesearchaeota archaeon]|nr:hypothetical protein [Candidatus Woesearchaeota archaeon]